MKLIAGIINYKSYEDTRACIECLKKSTRRPDRILVADNSSDPIQAADLAALIGSENVLASAENRGYSGGANVLVRAAADSEFVMILNPDVRVTPDFCAEMLAAAYREPRAAALTGKLLRPGGKILDSTGVVIYRTGRNLDRGAGTADDGRYDREEEVFAACGAAFLWRLAALEDLRVGEEYFDEEFFLYHEDVDLCWRARLLGWKILYVPTAVAFHERGYKAGQRNLVSQFVRGHAFKNHYLKLTKNLLPGQLWRDGLFLVLWEFLRFGYSLLREPFRFHSYFQAACLLPSALRKRRHIMQRRQAKYCDIAHWFI
jgi:GT2 family glycosyltransferase